jgi:sugar diacid utilization regulator
MAADSTSTLRRLLERLQSSGIIPDAVPVLHEAAQQVASRLRAAVLEEVPAFSITGNPDVLPGLERHATAHMDEIQRLFAGGDVGDFVFVRSHAHRRAEQRFPLEGTLRALRCAERVLAGWLREGALAVRPGLDTAALSNIASFASTYFDTVGAIFTADYVFQTRMLAEAEGDRRTELLNLLLSGYDEADQRVAQILRRAGFLEQRQAYCVVVAQSVNPGEMENPARAQRIATAIVEALAATAIRSLAGMRNGLMTVVLSDKRRQSGWTAPQSNLAERVRSQLEILGPAVVVGISGDHPSTAFIPQALNEATVALDFADVARRIVRFADLPVRDLLVHHGLDYVQGAPPAWIAALAEADARAGGALLSTLRAVADADLNMQQAARLLGRHPNTVYVRLEKVREITGLDAQRYRDLTELLLAADCCAR